MAGDSIGARARKIVNRVGGEIGKSPHRVTFVYNSQMKVIRFDFRPEAKECLRRPFTILARLIEDDPSVPATDPSPGRGEGRADGLPPAPASAILRR